MSAKALAVVLVASVMGSLFNHQTSAMSVPRNIDRKEHWGANMTTPELISSFGYPVEIHHVITDDGYILELHRIPYGLQGRRETDNNRPVAYLEHCLLGASSDYIMNEPGEALAYILADAGYDVWLSNMRGNTYSRNHTSLDPNDVKFWKFSWDEMAIHDVPTSIDYVLETTGADGVYYVGWSMGTTVFWAMMSENPHYNEKIKVMAAMAPVASLKNVEGPLNLLAEYSQQMETLLDLLGIGEVFPSNEFMDTFTQIYCDQNNTMVHLCYNFIYLVGGPDADEMNKEYLPVILSHSPAGTSAHTIFHFTQMMTSGDFCKYDYGTLGNMKHYGQTTPPHYNLSMVTAPVGLFWGNTDWIAVPMDVAVLAESLPNVVLNYNVPKEQWNHMDFGWGTHGKEYVYTKILELFSDY